MGEERKESMKIDKPNEYIETSDKVGDKWNISGHTKSLPWAVAGTIVAASLSLQETPR